MTAAVRSRAMSVELVPVPYGEPAAHARCSTRSWRRKARRPAGAGHGGGAHQLRRRRGPAAARRAGRSGRSPTGGDGVAGVTFLTVYRLAELLGAPRLAARAAGARCPPRCSPPRCARCWPTAPGMLRPGRRAPRHRGRAGRRATASSRSARRRRARRARAHRAARRRRRAHQRDGRGPSLAAEWYDERDLMDAAVDARSAPGCRCSTDLGAVVLHLPQELSHAGGRARCARSASACRSPSSPASPACERADAPVRDGTRAYSELDACPSVACRDCPRRPAVVSASDPDDEVRAVVRLVVDAVRDGVPLERMAVLYGAPEPYARLVHEQLDRRRHPAQRRRGAHARRQRARPWAARPARAPRPRLPAPRRHAPARHARRCSVTGGPVPRHAGSASAASPRSCAAPSTGTQRLERHAAHRRSTSWRRSGRSPTATPAPTASRHELADDARAAGLRRRPWSTTSRSTPPAELARARRLGRAARARRTWRPRPAAADWPEVERQAAEKVEAALDRLAGLDAVEAAPGLDVFRRTLELELDADLGRVGRFGDGVLVGHVALGLGLDLDRVFVCGLAEGTFPARVRDDSLLPDADRRATDGALRAARRRGSTTTTAACSPRSPRAPRARVLLFPRGDLRRTTERVPSRFLARAPSTALTGTGVDGRRRSRRARTPTGTRRCRRSPPGSRASSSRPPSRSTGCARCSTTPAAAARSPTHDARAASTSRCARGVDARRGAREPRVHPLRRQPRRRTPVPRITDGDVVVSPTRLRDATPYNPFDYLLEYVLRVEIAELPEERYELSPARPRQPRARDPRRVPRRGARPARAARPRPSAPWTDADRDRLREIAEAHVRALRGAGAHRPPAVLAPRPAPDPRRARPLPRRGRRACAPSYGLAHHRHRAALRLPRRRCRRSTSRCPTAARCASAARPTASTAPPTARSGHRLQDRPADRRRPEATPPSAGTLLQLPVYAHAAAGVVRRPRHAGGRGVLVREHARRASGGRSSCSPPRSTPASTRCCAPSSTASTPACSRAGSTRPTTWTRRWRSYSDPDARGTRDRYREWVRKRDAPELAGYVALAEPDDADDADADDAERGAVARRTESA